MKKIIAIDYDETITDNTPYPYEGNIRPQAIKYIKLLHDKGYTLVLWTSRKEKDYNKCIDRLQKENILQYFNFDDIEYGYSGKVIADFYIDDKGIPGKLNWRKIYKYIINNI